MCVFPMETLEPERKQDAPLVKLARLARIKDKKC